MLGLALWWWLLAPYSPVVQLAAIVVLFVVGLLVCRQVERRYGVHDPGAIVIDEIVGLWIALLGFGRHWPFALLGFALFRLFDISKPGVVRWADRQLTGGLGVMFDDVLAGCLAALGTQFAFWLWWFTAAGGFS